jgi:hypothetical protein
MTTSLEYSLKSGRYGLYLIINGSNYAIPKNVNLTNENISEDVIKKIVRMKELKNELNNLTDELKKI